MSPKREKHNEMEKRRRRIIKDHFDGLKDCIQNQKDSSGCHPKLSRAQTLQKAKLRIQELKLSITRATDSLQKIRAQNTALENALHFYKNNREFTESRNENVEFDSTTNDQERYASLLDFWDNNTSNDENSECVVVIEVSNDVPSYASI